MATGRKALIRKTLQERLDLAPMTRKAWNRALKENDDYQNSLREEIFKLSPHETVAPLLKTKKEPYAAAEHHENKH